MIETMDKWDPFTLGDKPRYKRFIMILLYIAGGTLLLSLLLYLLLSIFSDRNSKLSKYSKQVREWKTRGEDQKISDISVALKIMPSENTKGNMIVMEYLTEHMLKEKKLAHKYNYSESFFFHTNTSMYFPVFRFEEADIPVGDSEVYCVHLFWTPKENEATLELYDSLKGFPQCKKAFNKRVIWHQHDPTHGEEVYTWRQKRIQLDGCKDKVSCQKKCDKFGGIAKKAGSKGYFCYSYTVLTDICLKIDYRGADAWVYAGGCFEGGSAVRMVPALPGKIYNFENIRVHIRSVYDPFVVAAKENIDDEDFSFGIDIDFIYSFAFILLFIAIICGVAVAAGVILKETIFTTGVYQKFLADKPGIITQTENPEGVET